LRVWVGRRWSLTSVPATPDREGCASAVGEHGTLGATRATMRWIGLRGLATQTRLHHRAGSRLPRLPWTTRKQEANCALDRGRRPAWEGGLGYDGPV